MNTQQHERALVVATGRLQGLVIDLVREIHGDAAIERCARCDGDQFPELTPTPLAGLWAADELHNRVSQEVRRHARRAREAGHTWDEIGQALGIEPSDRHSVGEAAHVRFAGPPASWPLQGPSFVWRCPHCDRVISDRGLYEDHPDDNQPGHADGCVRLRDEIDRWRASWDDTGWEGRGVTRDTMTATAESTSPPEGKLLLTVEEAAHRLGIGRTVMYRLVSTGAVESVTLGRLRRVPSECLHEFVSALRHSHAGGDRPTAAA